MHRCCNLDYAACVRRPSVAITFLLVALMLTNVVQFRVAAAPSPDVWAVIVSTSRYWHNYRHSANALSFYHLCRQNGIPDDNILLFLADNVACSPRNVIPGTIYNNKSTSHRTNLYGCDVRVDFSGYDVSVSSFLQTMQGRYTSATPRTRRLLSHSKSNLLVYLTGHGGDGFLKFQDHSYLYTEELALMFSILHAQRMYSKALLVVETCHAESLCLGITAPNVGCIASSTVAEDSYAHHRDSDIGVDVIDKFSYDVLERLNGNSCTSAAASVYNGDVMAFFFPTGKRTEYRGAHRAPVNNYKAMFQWKLGDFFCGVTRSDDHASTAIPMLEKL